MAQVISSRSWREFIGSVTKLLTKHNVTIRRGEKEARRSQAIVERFNRILVERLFGIEMKSERLKSTEWVTRLSAVVSALNNEVMRLIGKKPSDAIKMKSVTSESSPPRRGKEQKLPDREAYVAQPIRFGPLRYIP